MTAHHPYPARMAEAPADPPGVRARPTAGRQLIALWPAAHLRLGVVMTLGLAAAAAADGRPAREVGLVAATVLVGQVLLGWDDDYVDADVDSRRTPGRPVPSGRIARGNVGFAASVAALLVVPLAMSHGREAGPAYLGALAVSMLGHRGLRRTPVSFVPWAAAFALSPAFRSYGGWGGVGAGGPPTWTITGLAAALGVCVHVLAALPGLVGDHEEGWRSLPLLVGLRTGATRLLVVAGTLTVVLLAGLVVSAIGTGLRG